MPDLDLVVGGIAIGVAASALMDLWSAVLRRRFGVPTLDYRLLGRWIGGMSKGRFVHERIAAAEPIPFERPLGWAAHYAIGITFALLLLAIWGRAWLDAPTLGPALAIGLGTIVAPWFVMQPAMGAGVAGSRTPSPAAVVEQVSEPEALLRAVRQHRPDVAIVDIRMPPTHTDEGLGAAEQIRAELGTAVGILVLSQHVEPSFALRLVSDGAGGVGYLLKDRVTDLDDFADAVRRIARGGSVIDPAVVARLVGRRARVPLDDLTEREREVLALMAEGRSNQAIGDRLELARKTVEAYIANIFSKLELPPAADDHRRVLAVLAHLRGGGAAPS